jgi:hypothetical protein
LFNFKLKSSPRCHRQLRLSQHDPTWEIYLRNQVSHQVSAAATAIITSPAIVWDCSDVLHKTRADVFRTPLGLIRPERLVSRLVTAMPESHELRMLCCLIDGESVVFPVRLSPDCLVGDLKKEIQKERQLDTLKGVGPHILELWKVSVIDKNLI